MPSREVRSAGRVNCWSPWRAKPKGRPDEGVEQDQGRIRIAGRLHARRRSWTPHKQAGRAAKPQSRVELEKEPGDDDDEDEFVEKEIARLLKEAKYVVEGYYGVDAITHCCLETHGCTLAVGRGQAEGLPLHAERVADGRRDRQGLKNAPEKMEHSAPTTSM